MPRAPEAQRQVVDQPFPNVRVSAAPTADTFGGQIGDTVAHTGVRAYDLFKRSADQTAVFESERGLADLQTQLEGQLYATKGKAVLGSDEQISKAFDAKVQELEQQLTNDQQRGAFRHTALIRRQQLNDSTQKYIRQEFGAFQDEETKATLESANDRTRRNPDSPVIIQQERQRANSALAAWGARKGMIGTITPEMLNDPNFQRDYLAAGQTPPTMEELMTPGASRQYTSKAFQEKKQIVESSLHRQVVDGLLAKDQDQAAADYLKANRDGFTANDLDSVEKHVEIGSTRGESRRQTAELSSKHDMETTEGRRAMMADAKAIKNDQVSDATVQRLEHEFQVYDKRKNEDQARRFELGAKVLDERGLKQPNAVLEDLLPIPLLKSLEAKDRDALRLHLDRIRKPADHAHDAKAWFEFQTLTDKELANVKPQALMGTYLNRFDGTHYDRALAEWGAARNKQDKGTLDDKMLSALTNRERIKNAWTESNVVDNALPRSKWTAQDEVNYSRFESEADRALSTLPKDAKPEQIQGVLSSLSDKLLKQKYTVDPGFFSRNKQVPAIGIQDVKDARSIRIPLAEIPTARQEALKGALKQAGVPITTATIEELEAKARLKKQGIP